jgi:hypothetical protein
MHDLRDPKRPVVKALADPTVRQRFVDQGQEMPRATSRGRHLPRLGAVALLIDFRFYELRQVSQRLLPAEVTRL